MWLAGRLRARHSRNPQIPLNHEKHENSRKKADTVLSRDCGKHTEHTEERQIQLHHEEHEGYEVKSGSAGHLTSFMHFAFGDQRFGVGSRPAGRRWRVKGNNYLFAGETRTVPGSPLHPSSGTFPASADLTLWYFSTLAL